ncbi:MAG: hypothetical protein AB7T49_18430 [Oligoflexales bacterium]
MRYRSLGICILLWATAANAAGQTLVDSSFATDNISGTFFSYNPAAAYSKNLKATIMQASSQRDDGFIVNPDSENAIKFDNQTKVKEEAVALMFPMGGASFGLAGKFTSVDFKGKNDLTTSKDIETQRRKDFDARFVMEITSSIRGAFNYHYQHLQSDILGAIFIDENDRTRFKGTLSGFSVGVIYEENQASVGAHYTPPMRGKAEIVGEQKILSAPGLVGIGGTYKFSNDFIAGLETRRWMHKRDDLDDPSTSPIDQRDISLNGLDAEQYYFPTSEYELGLDYLVNAAFKAGIAVNHTKGVFIFDGDNIPNDEKSQEYPIDRNALKLVLTYGKNEFFAKAGAGRFVKSRDKLKASSGNSSTGPYGSYKSEADFMFLSLGFEL